MDPFAIISAIETCYSLGTKLIQICQTWKDADEEVKQRVVIFESVWVRTKHQAEFMERVIPIMDDRLKHVHDNLLHQLSACLILAIHTLETVSKRDATARPSWFGRRPRAKKASWLWKKEAIDSIITDLRAWRDAFDPSWFMLTIIANPLVDREVAKARDAEAQTRPLVSEGPDATKKPFAVAAGLRHVLYPQHEQTKEVFLTDTPMEWRDIPFSSVKAGRPVRGSGTSSDAKWYIVDTVEVGEAARVRDIARDVGVLAVKLSRADPLAFGLLNCKGVVAVPRRGQQLRLRQQDLSIRSPPPPLQVSSSSSSSSPNQHNYSSFRLIFRAPESIELLQSLRHLLLGSDAHISLSRKIRIARELAKAVSYVHTFAFVHKNIRPESVLCFEEEQDLIASPSRRRINSCAFLVGFDAFRAADAGTLMIGDMRWDRNVYRHPLRQGDDPAAKHTMRHDIYSFGVCLLEIGLWESFVDYTTTAPIVASAGMPVPKLGKTYEHFQSWLRETPTTRRTEMDDNAANVLDTLPFRLKDYLVHQARTRLAPRMGEKYASIVLLCLTCLDGDDEDFGGVHASGDDTNDDTAIALGFIEEVMMSLDEIKV
ncbi:hypothetical protein F5Y03DRAFT_333675 [Xylaria venustula]|nr:hypothetical protein F5Y03DRAFT_333675 [Xylaria venustula]